MKLARVVLTTVGALAIAAAASAQAPPCPCPTTPPPPPLWTGEAGVSYIGTSGNTSTSSFGMNFDVKYLPNPWKFEAKFAFLRSESDQVVTAESYAGALTASRALSKRLDLYAGLEYYRNVFSGIERRYNGSAGAGYKIFDGPAVFLRPEVGFGYESVKRVGVGTDDYPIGRAALTFIWKFSKNGEFENDASFTDNLDNTDDWVFRNKASVTASLTSIFSLRLGWGIEYANRPTPGFKNTDTVTSAAIVAKF